MCVVGADGRPSDQMRDLDIRAEMIDFCRPDSGISGDPCKGR